MAFDQLIKPEGGNVQENKKLQEVDLLFKSNPELANGVYKTLGYKVSYYENDIVKNIKQIKPFEFNAKSGEPSIEWQYSINIDGDIYEFFTGIYLLFDEEGNSLGNYFDLDFTVNGSTNLINKDIFKRINKIKPILNAMLAKASKYSVHNIRIQAEDAQGKKSELQRINLYQRVMDSLGFTLAHKTDDGEVLFYEKPATSDIKLTSQQEGQAKLVYSQYLDTLASNKETATIEGFKDFIQKTQQG